MTLPGKESPIVTHILFYLRNHVDWVFISEIGLPGLSLDDYVEHSRKPPPEKNLIEA